MSVGVSLKNDPKTIHCTMFYSTALRPGARVMNQIASSLLEGSQRKAKEEIKSDGEPLFRDEAGQTFIKRAVVLVPSCIISTSPSLV